MRNPQSRLDDVSRRHFVESIAKTAFGLSVLPISEGLFGSAVQATVMAAPQKKAEHVIYLMMNGAMSHIDTFDPKPGKEEGGETKAIQTSVPGLKIAEHLPTLASKMDQLAVIRSMTTETGAHEQGRYLMRTSYKKIGTIRHPFLGSWLTHFEGKINKDLPGSVIVGGGSRHPRQGYLSAQVAPAPVGNPATGLQNTKSPKYLNEKNFEKRRRLINQFEAGFKKKFATTDVKAYTEYYTEAVRLLKSPDLAAFDISKEESSVKEAYGANRIGQGCLLARRLVEKGVRFVEIEHGGWDNHRDIYASFNDRAGQLDTAIGALLDDLKQRRLLDKTLIVLSSEFGRTPKINANAGRDHHPACFSSMLAGAGIKGGQIYGQTDEIGKSVEEGHTYPQDLNATIAYGCGLPLDKEVFSPSGRPFKVAHEGFPLDSLYS
ncbi:MAG: DUF1501 domain-containing protein [Fuerstiella sp.]|nr:DUF1501 domain-containing protein [Fuerstiella sp.]MCP4513437.1 DUF1501 domain-containing protein [Fuerstiella sp.]MDG2130106.1 DUF1501 domain-containing protein [Fuerstiella sp.]